MGIKVDVKREYIINGITYKTLEEVPAEIRQTIEETLQSSSIADLLKTPLHTKLKIQFNGRDYDNVESMPAGERGVYEAAMKAAGMQGVDPMIPVESRKSIPVSVNSSRPIVPESSLPVRWLIAGAVLLGLLGLLVGFSLLFSR
jgi:hypothetical protein